MSDPNQRVKRRGQPAVCPFCEEKIKRPAVIPEATIEADAKGGYCQCGALFLVDLTGKEGGRLLVEGLSLLCQGDMDRAMSMSVGQDYLMQSSSYNPKLHILETAFRGRTFGRPRLWFFKKTDGATPESKA